VNRALGLPPATSVVRPPTPLPVHVNELVGVSALVVDDAGMDDYISKPLERGELIACLNRWLG
jgi:hypothetical protein